MRTNLKLRPGVPHVCRLSAIVDGNKGKTVTLEPRVMRHFDHGYAVTSHSSQGLTSERVLVIMDTDVHPELINYRFAHVSVSRASHDAHVFTNNAATLVEGLTRVVSKTSAIEYGTGHSNSMDQGLLQSLR